jgi:lipid II:glycine glycyltransferase (peptidoglycan interpeptide bridge formation enzyme)
MNWRVSRSLIDTAWDDFVAVSPQGNVYASSLFLKSLEGEVAALYVFKNDQIKCGMPIYSNNSSNIEEHNLLIYSGPLYCSPGMDQNTAQINDDKYQAGTTIANYIMENFGSSHFATTPGVSDIRPFQWVNYHSDKAKFRVDLRYTTILDISELADAENTELTQLFKNTATLRRREIRKALQQGFVVQEHFNPEILLQLYGASMERQGLVVSDVEKTEMVAVMTNLVNANKGGMYICYDQQQPLNALFFGIHNNQACYLYGGTNPQTRYLPSGTFIFWKAFHQLSKQGVESVDLEGVNSPQRGWFKLSFGGRLCPYYWISHDKQS